MHGARRLLLLGAMIPAAGCSADPGSTADSAEPAAVAGNASEDNRIACALAGESAFAPRCTVERAPDSGTLFLVVRHPDGGFRRFEVLKDGRGIATADGSEQARTAMAGDLLEVTVGADRYRLPATRADHAAR